MTPQVGQGFIGHVCASKTYHICSSPAGDERLLKKIRQSDTDAPLSLASRLTLSEKERKERGHKLLRTAHDGTDDLEEIAKTIAQGVLTPELLTADINNKLKI
jgi:hypothetical protein